jgi:hypothetical protein
MLRALTLGVLVLVCLEQKWENLAFRIDEQLRGHYFFQDKDRENRLKDVGTVSNGSLYFSSTVEE